MTMKDEVRWSRRHFDMIALGGVWMVPRSGLMFKKIDDHTLELLTAMPFLEEMKEQAEQGKDVPKTKDDLLAFQQSDFDAIAKLFNLAGIGLTGRERII